jgi:hypothetical protein
MKKAKELLLENSTFYCIASNDNCGHVVNFKRKIGENCIGYSGKDCRIQIREGKEQFCKNLPNDRGNYSRKDNSIQLKQSVTIQVSYIKSLSSGNKIPRKTIASNIMTFKLIMSEKHPSSN